MGLLKAIEPMLPKVSVGPANMIVTATDPFTFKTPSQDASQPSANPLIKAGKRSLVTMFKVLKPSPKRTVHFRDNAGQTLSIGPTCLSADVVYHIPPFTPSSRASNMRSVQTERSTHPHLSDRASPTCLASCGTVVGCSSFSLNFTHPPPCTPSLHPVSGTSSLLWVL